MGLRGELQYYNCFISDKSEPVSAISTVNDLYSDLNADASTIFFDSRTAGGVTTKAGSVFEVSQGEVSMNRRIAPDKITFSIVAVGLDAKANAVVEAKVKALNGTSKYVYFVDPDTGVTVKANKVPIMVTRKWEANAKTEYTISADYETTVDNYTMDLV